MRTKTGIRQADGDALGNWLTPFRGLQHTFPIEFYFIPLGNVVYRAASAELKFDQTRGAACDRVNAASTDIARNWDLLCNADDRPEKGVILLMRTVDLNYVGRRIRSSKEHQASPEAEVTSWQ